jgi:hypothetical protein
MPTPSGIGEVRVRKLASGTYTFEVAVPAAGPGLEEMQEASRIAQLIWDQLDEKIRARRESELVIADVGDQF